MIIYITCIYVIIDDIFLHLIIYISESWSSTSERCSEPLRSFLFFRNFMRPNLGTSFNSFCFVCFGCLFSSVSSVSSGFLGFSYFLRHILMLRSQRGDVLEELTWALFRWMSKDSPWKRIPWNQLVQCSTSKHFLVLFLLLKKNSQHLVSHCFLHNCCIWCRRSCTAMAKMDTPKANLTAFWTFQYWRHIQWNFGMTEKHMCFQQKQMI